MITIIQGAQWGSEAKGSVTAWMAKDYQVAVRTGSINAGHTFYTEDGEKHVMQQLPCAWHNPDCTLVLGPGAYIHYQTLEAEINHVLEVTGEDLRTSGRLVIDHRCGVHLDEFSQQSKDFGRSGLIGATGKGCAEAVINKIRNRNVAGATTLFHHLDELVLPYRDCFQDVPEYLAWADDEQMSILIEGTQGQYLDLHTGPYPFTTNRQTLPASWLSECGLAPTRQVETILVARTYPIRVAGNSGPMPDEITWPHLVRYMNNRLRMLDMELIANGHAIDDWVEHQIATFKKYGLPGRDPGEFTIEEREWHGAKMLDAISLAWNTFERRDELDHLFEVTTVTKRLRRIAELNVEMLARAVRIENPAGVFLTFLNYKYPEIWGLEKETSLKDEHMHYIEMLERRIDSTVLGVSCGPFPRNHFHITTSGPGVVWNGTTWRAGQRVRRKDEPDTKEVRRVGMVENLGEVTEINQQNPQVRVRWSSSELDYWSDVNLLEQVP